MDCYTMGWSKNQLGWAKDQLGGGAPGHNSTVFPLKWKNLDCEGGILRTVNISWAQAGGQAKLESI